MNQVSISGHGVLGSAQFGVSVRRVAIRVFSFFVVWGGLAAWGVPSESRASASSASEATDGGVPVSHVIQVSVDALGAKYLEKFLKESPEEFPNFARLIHEGASTLNARTDSSRTTTLQNHTSMVTGRPVLTPEHWKEAVGHGLLLNKFPDESIESLHSVNPEGGYTASVFDVAHEHGVSTALYSGKSKFEIYAVSYGPQFGREGPGGRNKVDFKAVTDGSPIHEKAMADLKEHKPGYAFLHYPEPDGAGHKFGYLGPEYREAIKKVDGYLGDLMQWVQSDENWKGRTVIIVSADHGGRPETKSHGDADHPYNFTIPFLVWGAGVAPGADLYALNPNSRRDPGESRPEYAPTGQPIRNGDGGNLALKLLGLPPIPGSSINNKQDLSVR